MAEALFTPLDGERILPTDLSRGPWSRDSLHGGPVAAVLGGTAEALLDGLQPARVTIELLRPVPVVPLRARAEVLRPGRKVRLVAAELATEDGTVVATATVLAIRQATVDVPETPDLPPAPPPVEAGSSAERTAVAVADDYDAFHNAGVEHRFVRGAFHDRGPATDWIRLRVPVLAGRPPTPLERVLAAADFGNGVSALADFTTLLFINPDLTVHLHRLPVGEWVCLEAATVLEPHGVGLAESRLWDADGLIGRALQSLLIEGR